MKEYKYQGEVLSVKLIDSCEIEVSNGANATTIHSLNSIYAVPVGPALGATNSFDSIERATIEACANRIQFRGRRPESELCKEMSDFVEKLQ